MKYFCETCKRLYDTEEEVKKCEAKHEAAKEEKKKKNTERKLRVEEITKKYNELDELIKAYNKDYPRDSFMEYSHFPSRETRELLKLFF